MKGFTLETTPDEKYCFIIFNAVDDFCHLPEYCFKSSYNIVAARAMGMRFSQWLLYCAAQKAIIEGKTGYSIAKWKIEDKGYARKILNELNKQWDLFMAEVNFNGNKQ